MTAIRRRPLSATDKSGILTLTSATTTVVHVNGSTSHQFVQLALSNSHASTDVIAVVTVSDGGDVTETLSFALSSTATETPGISVPVVVAPGFTLSAHPGTNDAVKAFGWVEN